MPTSTDRNPWWKYPIVWLVISGPAIVVVASFATLGLALKYPDPPLHATADAPRAPAEEASEVAAPYPQRPAGH